MKVECACEYRRIQTHSIKNCQN